MRIISISILTGVLVCVPLVVLIVAFTYAVNRLCGPEFAASWRGAACAVCIGVLYGVATRRWVGR